MLERWHMQLKDFIRDKQGEDFCIPEMTEQSVRKALASPQINKFTGSDNISAKRCSSCHRRPHNSHCEQQHQNWQVP